MNVPRQSLHWIVESVSFVQPAAAWRSHHADDSHRPEFNSQQMLQRKLCVKFCIAAVASPNRAAPTALPVQH